MTTVAREETIVQAVIRAIRQRGGWAEKTHGTAFGMPRVDVTGCLDGRRVEIEVKRPGQKPTPRQIMALSRWAKAGAVTGVVTSVEELDSLLEGAL